VLDVDREGPARGGLGTPRVFDSTPGTAEDRQSLQRTELRSGVNQKVTDRVRACGTLQPLPGQSLLVVEPYPAAVLNTYTVPFRGGLLIYVVPPGKRVVGMVDMVGVES